MMSYSFYSHIYYAEVLILAYKFLLVTEVIQTPSCTEDTFFSFGKRPYSGVLK